MSFDVISFGSAIVDFFLQSEEFKIFKSPQGKKIIGGLYGDKIEVGRRIISSGGGGTNTAVSFARQGFNAGVVSLFGKDVLGEIIIEELKFEGVNTELLVREEKGITDTSIIIIGPDGGRTILVCRGQTRLEKKFINWQNLKSDWFYITSLEGNLDLVEEIINFGRQKDIKISWNPGKRELKNQPKVKELARKTTVFNLNREEMERLTKAKLEDKSFWQEVKDLGASFTIVTNGRQGAYLLHSQGVHFALAKEVNPVDETGAGDAFGSGFVAGLIKGMDVESSLDLAINNSASVVQHIGPKKGLIKNPSA